MIVENVNDNEDFTTPPKKSTKHDKVDGAEPTTKKQKKKKVKQTVPKPKRTSNKL